MAADVNQLKAFQKSLQEAIDHGTGEVAKRCVNGLAQMLLAGAQNDTPVVTGTLRRGWKATPAVGKGDRYSATVYNDVEYAEYVEYGHRTANKAGWVEGRMMMTSNEKKVNDKADVIIRSAANTYLQEVLNGDK